MGQVEFGVLASIEKVQAGECVVSKDHCISSAYCAHSKCAMRCVISCYGDFDIGSCDLDAVDLMWKQYVVHRVATGAAVLNCTM